MLESSINVSNGIKKVILQESVGNETSKKIQKNALTSEQCEFEKKFHLIIVGWSREIYSKIRSTYKEM